MRGPRRPRHLFIATLAAAALGTTIACGNVRHALTPYSPTPNSAVQGEPIAATLAASPTPRAMRLLGPDGKPIPPSSLPPTLHLPPPITPSSQRSPQSCGNWSSATDPVGAAITQRYGQIRYCLLIGNTWVMTTLGTAIQSGTVATYDCSDAACLDANTDHPLSGWQFNAPPTAGKGGVTVLPTPPNLPPHVIKILADGTAFFFNVDTKTFSQA